MKMSAASSDGGGENDFDQASSLNSCVSAGCFSAVLPPDAAREVAEMASLHRASQSRGRAVSHSPRGSFCVSASPRGSVFQAEKPRRRSLGSQMSVCNAATIQIPDYVPNYRMSMESTCSEFQQRGSMCSNASFAPGRGSTCSNASFAPQESRRNSRASFSVAPNLQSTPEDAPTAGEDRDAVDVTIDGFEAVVWQHLQKALQDITDEYAQRLATLVSQRGTMPASSAGDATCASEQAPPEDGASQAASAPAKVDPLPKLQIPAALTLGPASPPTSASRSPDDTAPSKEVSSEAEYRSETSAKGPSALLKTKTMPVRDRRSIRRSLTAPTQLELKDDKKEKSKEKFGSNPGLQVPSESSPTGASEAHGNLALPKMRGSNVGPSLELPQDAARGSARGSSIMTSMRNLEDLSSAVVGSAPRRASHRDPRGSHVANGDHDTIDATKLNNFANDVLNTRGYGNSLEAELDKVLQARGSAVNLGIGGTRASAVSNCGRASACAAPVTPSSPSNGRKHDRNSLANLSPPQKPRPSLFKSKSADILNTPQETSNKRASSAEVRERDARDTSTPKNAHNKRMSVENEIDARYEAVALAVQQSKHRGSFEAEELSPPAQQPSATTHDPPEIPIENARGSQDSLPLVSQADEFVDGAPTGMSLSAEDINRVRMRNQGADGCDSQHTGSSQSEEEDHVFQVLAVYETRVKSVRVTRTQNSLQFGFESSENEDNDSEDDDDGRCITMRRCCRSECALRSNSLVKIIWDFVGFILISYDFIMIPMNFFEMEETTFLWTMAWVVRIYWTGDFPISMVSAYELSNGMQERRIGRVVLHYWQSWAVFDVCILSLDYLENAVEGLAGLGAARAGKIGKSVRLLRMFRVLRMLRRNTLPEPLKQIAYKLQSEQYMILFGIWRIIVFLLGLVHLIACVWYGIGNGAQSSWVQYYKMEDTGLDWQYFSSFHWSLTQFAGSMDIQPHNVGDRLFAILALIMGFLVSAVVVSSITSSMTRLQIVLAHESTQKSLLSNYLVDNGISTKLALRVQRNATYAYQQDKKNLPESSIELLQLVSEPLRVELHYEMYMPQLTTHPFFQLYNQMNPSGMRNLCHAAVCRIQLAIGDILFSAGEAPVTPWMYFLTVGQMLYFQESSAPGSKPSYVSQGQWCCEPVLWTSWIHHGTMRAKSEITLMGIRAGSFQDVMCRFQCREFTPKSYAEEFVTHLNSLDHKELTDLPPNMSDIVEYCHKAVERCAMGGRADKSCRSLASMSLSSQGSSSASAARIADLNATMNNMAKLNRVNSKKSVASSVASMFKFGRSSTRGSLRSLSMMSRGSLRSTVMSTVGAQRSTVGAQRSTVGAQKSVKRNRSSKKVADSPAATLKTQESFTLLESAPDPGERSETQNSLTSETWAPGLSTRPPMSR